MTEPSPKMLSVLRGDRNCIGFVSICARGFKAYDGDGRPLGMFANENDAARAVYQAATPSGE